MGDLFEAINTNAEEAAARAREDAEALQKIEEARAADKKRVTKMRHLRATRTLAFRLVIAAAIIVCVGLATRSGYMLEDFAILVISMVFSWFAFWAGAWVQFVWCKGGLLA